MTETLALNMRLIRENMPQEIPMFEFWNVLPVPGQWIRGCLPSVFLGELILRDHYQWREDWHRVHGDVVVEGREPWDMSLAVWPYDIGVRGIRVRHSLVWAAGPEGVEGWKHRGLYKFFQTGVPTPAGESWYIQGRGQFFWVFRQVPGQDMEVLKICGDTNRDGQFDIACVQRRRQNVKLSQVVYTTALDGEATALPLVLVFTDMLHLERLCFFHCAMVPEKLLRDFQLTMAEPRNGYGWVPPAEVNPYLYEHGGRGRYIPDPKNRPVRRAEVWTP